MSVTQLNGTITLPASKFISSITSLIGDVRFRNTIETTSKMSEIIDSVRQENVEFGKGIIYDYTLGFQTVKDLSETSSLLTIEKPALGQEVIEIDNYKTIKVSVSEVLTRDAFLNGNAVNTAIGWITSILQKTRNNQLFGVANGLYQNWVPGQASQTITIDLISEEGLTGEVLKSTKELNASTIAKIVRKTMNNMSIPSNKYTDIATYVDPNDGETKNVISCFEGNDSKLIVNDKFWTDYLADARASLYHGEEIGNMFPAKVTVIPEDSMIEANANVIGWLSYEGKFAMSDFYNLAYEFFDASTLYNHLFLHYAYGAGVFKYAPGVKFVANYEVPQP